MCNIYLCDICVKYYYCENENHHLYYTRVFTVFNNEFIKCKNTNQRILNIRLLQTNMYHSYLTYDDFVKYDICLCKDCISYYGMARLNFNSLTKDNNMYNKCGECKYQSSYYDFDKFMNHNKVCNNVNNNQKYSKIIYEKIYYLWITYKSRFN